jgi:hypothetical protein
MPMTIATNRKNAPLGPLSTIGARRAQKFDETCERDAKAHAAHNELECVGAAHTDRFGSLMHIEQTQCGDDQRQNDARRNMAILAGHLRLPGETHITLAGTRGPGKLTLSAKNNVAAGAAL